MAVSLIVPAFNEEQRLRPFLQSMVSYLEAHPTTFDEVIIVNDGSSDRTAAVATEFTTQLPLRVLEHTINQGKGAAVQTGMLAARGDYRIFMDADGATPISELPKIVAGLSANDIAVGNRWIAGAHTTRHSWLRKVASWTYRTYLGFFGLGGIDTMCGCKGYRATVAIRLFNALQEKRWLFDTEIAYRAIQEHFTIVNIPIEWESKDGSKLDTRTLLKSAWQIWPLVRRIKQTYSA